jgi:NDP-sugar pyrophosphorylase family protein
MKALILAAGRSTRIAPVSGGSPKPLLRIAGETILARNLRWLAEQGLRQVWINLHFRPEEIRTAVGDGSRFGLLIRYVEEPEILGTAGAVRNLASEWEDTFLVVYGDNLVRMDLQALVRFHRERRAIVSVAVYDSRRHPHTGIAGGLVKLAPDGRIEKFCEHAAVARSPLVNAGIYVLEPEVVAEIPFGQFYDFGQDLFPRLLAAGRALYGHIMSGYCLGLDTAEGYAKAIELIERGEVQLS